MSRIGLVWAQARNGVIGAEGGIPWHIPEDLAHFRAVTGSSPVVMGRRTWESLPDRFRPLPGRENIVVTRQPTWEAEGARRIASLGDLAATTGDDERVWVIGGGMLYAEAIGSADVLEVTDVDLAVDGDTVAPPLSGWEAAEEDPAAGWHTSRTGIRYRFVRYRRAV